MAWYCTQQFFVRWGNVLNVSFSASNGVRQGGIQSPLLFNLYMDGISNTLHCCQQGCIVNRVPVDHIMYADNVVLLAISAHALQLFLNQCDSHVSGHGIVNNTKKTVCMCVKPKQLKSNIVHEFYYLEITLTCSRS